MGKYDGFHCPVCDKPFTDADDIVVCPECGAPHHRQCYLDHGSCALKELHGTEKSWWDTQKNQTQQENTQEALRCPNCGTNNPSDGLFCVTCGKPLKDLGSAQNFGYANQNNPQNGFGGQSNGPIPPFGMPPFMMGSPYGGLDPQEKIDGIKVSELQEFVGENSAYYLPKFKAMSQGKNTSWSWSGAFISFYYFLYRKVYSFAVIAAIVSTLIFVLSGVLSMRVMPDMLSAFTGVVAAGTTVDTSYLFQVQLITQGLTILAGVIFGIFANRIYKGHVFRSIRKLKQRYGESAEYHQALRQKGGVNRKGVLIFGVVMVTLYMVSSLMLLYFGM